MPFVVMRGDGNRLDKGRLLLERAVWPVRVVVGDVLAQHPLEVGARNDQDPIKTLATGAADPALRVRLRPRRRDRRPDDPDPFRAEDLVEGGRELAVAVADQEARPLLLVGDRHDQVARLLRDPGAVRVRGHAGQMHATTLELDEEEHVQASQPERLDREEVTLEDPGRLLAQERPPAHTCALGAGSMPWRWSRFQTLLAASGIPSPTSSPWIRLYPQLGFSAASRRISCRVCASSGGRPGRRPSYVQRRRTSAR